MWMLSFLPDAFLFWVINLILVLGLIGTLSSFFIRFIPFLFPYATPIKITGIVLLVIGVWFRGGYDNEMSWRAKVAEFQAKVDAAEKQSQEATKKLDGEIKKSKEEAKNTTKEIKNQISENSKQLDSECRISNVAIEIHNEAAQNKKPKK